MPGCQVIMAFLAHQSRFSGVPWATSPPGEPPVWLGPGDWNLGLRPIHKGDHPVCTRWSPCGILETGAECRAYRRRVPFDLLEAPDRRGATRPLAKLGILRPFAGADTTFRRVTRAFPGAL